MNIYIKTFNRPFYLDRCIRSIKFNVRNYGRIIVLDDGTLRRYQDKLLELHPDVEIVRSNADDDKFRLLREEKFDEITKRYVEPSQFWVQEIEKEKGDYFFLLEDDTWVVNQLDLSAIEQNLSQHKALLLQTWWPPYDVSGDITYQRYSCSDGNQIEYYRPDLSSDMALYKIWVICMAVFERTYFLNNFRGLKRMADEQTQLIRAFQYQQQHPTATFAKTAFKAVYQGWAIPGRATPEYYDLGLRLHLYIDALNEAWYEGRFDVNQSYPYDYDDNYLLPFFQESIVPQSVKAWSQWKKQNIEYLYD